MGQAGAPAAPTETAAALEAGKQLATLGQEIRRLDEGAPFVLGRDGQPVSLEAFLERPLRIQQRVSFLDVASFVDYVQRYKPDEEVHDKRANSESAVLFADADAGTVTAYLDYHGPLPAHLEHTATLVLRRSEEWQAWTSRNGQQMGQDALAEFLEERVLDIREPESASVLEAVRNLKLSRNSRYERTTDLTNGNVQLHYVDETQNPGKYTLPSELTLALRVWEHGEYYEARAQLRYRLREDKLWFQYKLQRPDLIQRDAFRQILETVEAGTGIRPLIGSVR